MLERRVTEFELRDLSRDDSRLRFTGYATVYGERNPWFNEVTKKGAHTKTLSERGTHPINASHDAGILLGFTTSEKEDRRGLLITGALNADVQAAREWYSLMEQSIEANTPIGISREFTAVKDAIDSKGLREITEEKIHGYAMTAYQSVPSATIVSLRDTIALLRGAGLELSREQEALAIQQLLRAADPTEAEPLEQHSANEWDAFLTELREVNQALRI